MEIKERIRTLREAKRFSQYDMADRLSISQSTYLQIEKGKTELTVTRLIEIADVLETSLAVLLGLEEQKASSGKDETQELRKKVSELQDRLHDKDEILLSKTLQLNHLDIEFSNFLLRKVAESQYYRGFSRLRIFKIPTGRAVKIITQDPAKPLDKSKIPISDFIEYLHSRHSDDIWSEPLDYECHLIPTHKKSAINLYFAEQIVKYGDDREIVHLLMSSGVIKDELLITAYKKASELAYLGLGKDEDVNADLEIVKAKHDTHRKSGGTDS